VKNIVRDMINKLWSGNVKRHELPPAGKRADAAEESLAATEDAARTESAGTGAVKEDVAAGEVGIRRPLEEESMSNGATEVGETAAPLETASLGETLVSRAGPSADAANEPLLRAAHRCHVGAVRPRNEDSCFTFVATTGGKEPLVPFGLFIVADGMGGHFAGHEASKAASRIVAEQVLATIYLPLLKGDGRSPQRPQQPVQEVMERAVQAANTALYSPEPDKDSGTTVTAVLIVGRRLYLAHVGDSRAYLLQDGQLELLTTDHSYVQRLQTVGQLTSEEAASHPQRNVLYRAVGQGGKLEIDTYTRSLTRPGKLLLCSDGLWGLAPDVMMHAILEEDLSLEEKVDKLTSLALQGGGHDNITAVVVEFAV
jgi:PPM family protein phosphatase